MTYLPDDFYLAEVYVDGRQFLTCPACGWEEWIDPDGSTTLSSLLATAEYHLSTAHPTT